MSVTSVPISRELVDVSFWPPVVPSTSFLDSGGPLWLIKGRSCPPCFLHGIISHELPPVMVLCMTLQECGVSPKLASSQFFHTTVTSCLSMHFESEPFLHEVPCTGCWARFHVPVPVHFLKNKWVGEWEKGGFMCPISLHPVKATYS